MMRCIFVSGTLRMFPYTSVLIRTNKAFEKITAELWGDHEEFDQRERRSGEVVKLSFDRRGGIFPETEKQHSGPFRNCCAQSHKVLPDSQIVPAALKFRRSFYRRYFPEAEDLAHWYSPIYSCATAPGSHGIHS